MKRGYYFAAGLAALTLLCSGCSAQSKNENLSAGMAAIAALEYDNALASFEAARAAGEDERLICRRGTRLYGENYVFGGGTGLGKCSLL